MSEQDDWRRAMTTAAAYVAESTGGERCSLLLLVIDSKGATKKVFVSADSAALLTELGKIVRFLERTIDAHDGMENQAGEMLWHTN